MNNCWICGKPATKLGVLKKWENGSWSSPLSNQRCYCDSCFSKVETERRESKEQYLRLKKALMLERAIRLLEKQGVDIYDYKEEIETVSEYINENLDKFDSADEIVACIILLWNRVQAKPQYKIGKHRVDFYIPEHKIILEIDGYMHKHITYEDSQRDITIREQLGDDWEVVRIGTEHIESKAELLWQAVLTMRDYKRKLRKDNYGELPEWFSERTKSHKPKKVTIGDDVLLED